MRRLFVARALRADTVSDSGTPSAPFHPAQKCRGSNEFRLRCRVSALYRQTDAFVTIMWCLVMTHMVKFMRYDRIGRANTNIHAPARRFCAAQTWALGVTESLTVSARSAQSTNGRLPYHQMMSRGDIHGLTRAASPRRGGEKLRCEVRSDHFESVRSYVREPSNGHGAG